MPGRSSSLPLMQRFPPQHMESREQRLRIFRQGRQIPRASLQKSSPSQSSSTAQTPASCVVEKRETWLDLKDKGGKGGKANCANRSQLLQIARGAQHQVVCTRGTNYLQGVSGSVPRASRGGGARAGADSVGAPAPEDPRQVLDRVGVHRDRPCLNYFP